MQKIMSIFDVFESPNRGVVVGGVNDELNRLSPAEMRSLVGETIELHNPSGSVAEFAVVDVETSSSLAGQKNIFILLPPQTSIRDVELGATVYSCSELVSRKLA